MKVNADDELKSTYGIIICEKDGQTIHDYVLSFEKVIYDDDGTPGYEDITKEEFLTEFQEMTGYEYVNEVFWNW